MALLSLSLSIYLMAGMALKYLSMLMIDSLYLSLLSRVTAFIVLKYD